MSKQGRAPTRSQGFGCRSCTDSFLWIRSTEVGEAEAFRDAAAQARALGWLIPADSDENQCPDCQEVKT